MRPHCFAYLDNINIVSESFGEHLYWLKKVLNYMYGAGLTIDPEKACFVDLKSNIFGIALIFEVYN